MVLTSGNMITAGGVLLAVVAIAYGGTFMLRVHAGNPTTNDLQRRSSGPDTPMPASS